MEWYYSDKEPQLIREFITKYVKLSKAPYAGKTPVILPWQERLFRGFGWHNEKGRPKHKMFQVWLPKKNCKSPTAAIIGVQQLLRYRGNDISIISATAKQAGMVFEEAGAIIEQNRELSKRLRVRWNLNVIEDRKGYGKIQVLACRPEIDGFNCSVIADEVAAWPKCHAQVVLDKIRQAGDSKPFSFKLFLSTAQHDKTHPGYDFYRLAKDVDTGEITNRPDVLPIIYEVPEHSDWRNTDLIRAANPACDAGIIEWETIQTDLDNIATEPKTEAGFRIFRCNQWGVGFGEAWLPGHKVSACRANFTEDVLLECDECYIGVDYARKIDLCAYAIVGRKGDLIYVLPRFFIAEEQAWKKQKTDNVKYDYWKTIPECRLTLTEGDVVDPTALRESLIADYHKFRPREIAFDPWGLEESRQVLVDQGLPMIEVPPLPKYITGGMVRLERAVEKGLLQFQAKNEIYEWNLNNARTKPIGGSDYVRLSKALSAGRIDGVFATVLALSRLVANEQALTFGVF